MAQTKKQNLVGLISVKNIRDKVYRLSEIVVISKTGK